MGGGQPLSPVSSYIRLYFSATTKDMQHRNGTERQYGTVYIRAERVSSRQALFPRSMHQQLQIRSFVCTFLLFLFSSRLLRIPRSDIPSDDPVQTNSMVRRFSKISSPSSGGIRELVGVAGNYRVDSSASSRILVPAGTRLLSCILSSQKAHCEGVLSHDRRHLRLSLG